MSGLPALLTLEAARTAAALRLAGAQPLLLLSAPGAAAALGPEGWQALVTRIRGLAPGARCINALCCADMPGFALEALRAGCRLIVLDGACLAYPAVLAAAAACGARLLPARPAALDLCRVDLRRQAGRDWFLGWLASHPHDSGEPTR